MKNYLLLMENGLQLKVGFGGGMKLNHFRFIAFALLLVFATNISVMALSPEAQAAIEEMRERILQRDTVAAPVVKTSPPGVYIPGRELEIALARVRIALRRDQLRDIPQANEQPKISLAVSNDVGDDASYRPGSLLKAAMKRVRAVRNQSWPTIQMEFSSEPSQALTKKRDLSTSETQLPAEKNIAPETNRSQKMRAPLSKTPDFVEVDTAKRLEQRRRQLLRSENLPDLSSPAESAKIQSVLEPDSLDPEQESKEFNRYISRYEYKMPSNYRIIVR